MTTESDGSDRRTSTGWRDWFVERRLQVVLMVPPSVWALVRLGGLAVEVWPYAVGLLVLHLLELLGVAVALLVVYRKHG